jgi:hypothetical protein
MDNHKTYNVVLHDHCDQDDFLNETLDDHCHCVNTCDHIPNVLVMKLSPEAAEELKNNPSVKFVGELLTPYSPDLPPLFSKTRTFTGQLPPFSQDPKEYGPLQFYYLNNQINSNGLKIGTHRWTGTPPPINDDATSINGRYMSYWTGKDIDIVSIEVPSTTLYSHQHPDFIKVDDPLTSKVIPKNWSGAGITSLRNTAQVGSPAILTSHAMGVLSAAAGTYCGYAKKSNLYVLYIDNNDVVSCINAVINFHNSKGINPVTGVKNPTILIHEYQYLNSNYHLWKVENITEIRYYNTSTGSLEIINRPVGGWGNDFTPFTSRNFSIKRVNENGNYHWCAASGWILPEVAIKQSISSAVTAGIVNVVPAGNDCGVFGKDNELNYNARLLIEPGPSLFTTNRSGQLVNISSGTITSESIAFPFRAVGPAGVDTAIDVAAGQNSEAHPVLDSYSCRGTSIDIVGLGSNTFTAAPGTLYADGNYWGMFSGTSCAGPTVAGILACLMEKYRYYNGSWPTPKQAKEILLVESKKNILVDTTSTTWNNVPPASVQIRASNLAVGPVNLLLTYDGLAINGGLSGNELLATTNKRVFIDNNIVKNKVNNGTRPAQGQIFPRSKIKVS